MSKAVVINRSDVSKDWHTRGFSCGLWIDHAGREWSGHPHQTDELFMMLSGDLELKMEGQSILPSIGEEIRLPAGVTHTIRNIGGRTACWLYGIRREATASSTTSYSFHEMTHATS